MDEDGAEPPAARVPRSPRRRRRAVWVNDVDERLLARGATPSWRERVSAADAEPPEEAPDDAETSNDARLEDDLPPHWQPR